jgi:hypothetical protein
MNLLIRQSDFLSGIDFTCRQNHSLVFGHKTLGLNLFKQISLNCESYQLPQQT